MPELQKYSPALVMHRYFVGRIDAIVVGLEQETIKLVDAMHGENIDDVGHTNSVDSSSASMSGLVS